MGIYDFSTAHRSRITEMKAIGLSGQDDLRVGFGERFSNANKLTFDQYTPLGRDRLFENHFAARDKILMENGLIESPLLTTIRQQHRDESGGYPRLATSLLGRPIKRDEKTGLSHLVSEQEFFDDNKANEEFLTDLIANNPELGILSDEEISSQVIMDQIQILATDSDLAERSSFLGKVGNLAGIAFGWGRDPTHLFTALVGGTPTRGASALTNFFKVGRAEASVVAALEVVEKKSEVAVRRKTGEPDLTTGQAFLESFINIAAGGVIGGAAGAAVGRFLRPLPASLHNSNNAVTETTQDIVNKAREQQARGVQLDPEIEQAVDLLDESLQIARSAPDNIYYETHMSNYAEARASISKGETIQPLDNRGITRASDVDVDAPQGSQTINPDATPEIQDIVIADLRVTLEKQDIKFQTTNIAGDLTTVSARDVLRGLDAEDAAVRATIDCLG